MMYSSSFSHPDSIPLEHAVVVAVVVVVISKLRESAMQHGLRKVETKKLLSIDLSAILRLLNSLNIFE